MKDKTLLNIPNTLEKVCFPMAFLSNANGNIIDVVESGAEFCASYLKTKQTNIFIPCPIELQIQLHQHLPYFHFEFQISFLIVTVLILQDLLLHSYNCIFNLLNIFIIMLK